MAVHDPDCTCDTYGCVLRRKGVQVSPAAMPNRQHHVHRPIVKPSWEAGTTGEQRPGGGRMPYLKGDGTPITVKQFANKRGIYTEKLREVRTPTTA